MALLLVQALLQGMYTLHTHTQHTTHERTRAHKHTHTRARTNTHTMTSVVSSKSVPNKLLTLVFVREAGRILLGLKKRGFGAGRWNGFGGKVEPGETVLAGAARELQEESGLVVDNEALRECGRIFFEFKGDPRLLEVHVFQTRAYQGIPTESEEVR